MAYLPATFLAESPDVDVYAREPVQANYIASPDPDTQWRPGTQPLDTLPTQWWNYFNNLYTKQINTTNKYLKQVISEIADCVGASIDNTDSLQLKAAVTDKIDQLKAVVDDLQVNDTAATDVTTSTSSAGTSTHAARVDHVHKIADSAVTRAKIAASTITMDRLARVTPGNNTTTAVAIAQAYNATLANKLANAGIVSVQTAIPASATNEAAYCVPNVAAVRSFVGSNSPFSVPFMPAGPLLFSPNRNTPRPWALHTAARYGCIGRADSPDYTPTVSNFALYITNPDYVGRTIWLLGEGHYEGDGFLLSQQRTVALNTNLWFTATLEMRFVWSGFCIT